MPRAPFRRFAQVGAFAALLAASIIPAARAQSADFPSRPITLIVGFSAGGSNDITARAIAQPLAQTLGVPVIVENRVGAAGTIGASHVAKSAPDGYTLMVSSASPLVVSPHTHASIPYDALTDFAGISLIGVTPEILAINPAVSANDLKELVELARQRELSVASSGNGGLPHLAIELFRSSAAGAKLVHIPYKGATPAVVDTLAGHVDAVVVDLPAVYQHIKEGKLKGIAVANETRSEFLPDLPTSGQQGLPGFVAVNWIGLVAPAKTPKSVIDKLHTALLEVTRQPQVKQALDQSAVALSVSDSPANFDTFIVAEHKKWGKVVKDSGTIAAN